jgi:hypothetical protein
MMVSSVCWGVWDLENISLNYLLKGLLHQTCRKTPGFIQQEYVNTSSKTPQYRGTTCCGLTMLS